jgi:hypothetical protein
MIAERRLAKVEGALSPKVATLLWLAEAHQFGSLPAYVAWLIDQPVSAAPLERVPAQARAAAVQAMRGQLREAAREAAHVAVRDAIFLVELVLKLNVAAEETIRIEGPRYAALFWEMRAISAEAELARRNRSRTGRSGSTLVECWQERWTATGALLTGIYAAEEARALLERRYLDGTPTLFPDLAADWLRLREQAERLAGIGDLVDVTAATVDGGRRRRGPSSRRPEIDLRQLRAAALDRAPEEAASLVDAARAAALDALGDTVGAATIAERRLRANATPASTVAFTCRGTRPTQRPSPMRAPTASR